MKLFSPSKKSQKKEASQEKTLSPQRKLSQKEKKGSSLLAPRFLLAPVVTEKTHRLMTENNTYTFLVHPEATKQEIAQAIEELYEVHVQKVGILRRKPRKRRFGMIIGKTKQQKRALVVVSPGEKIDIFE